MPESLFFVVPVTGSVRLEAAVTAELARRILPGCSVAALTGVDLEFERSAFDVILEAGSFVQPFEPRALSPSDLLALAAPSVLRSLLKETDAAIWCGSGIVPRSSDIEFGSSPVTLAALATLTQRGSLTPSLPAPLWQRAALPDPRLVLVTNQAVPFLEDWMAVGHDAVVEINQAPVQEHMDTFVARAIGRTDVEVDNSSLLMSWVDFAAAAAGNGGHTGTPSFLDATSLFADAVNRSDEDDEGPSDVEWEMVFNRARDAEPVKFVRNLIDETIGQRTSSTASVSNEFVWSVRRSLDPFGYRWHGPDSSTEFLGWLLDENQFGFTRASDLAIRSTEVGREFPNARYIPADFHEYLDRGGVNDIGFDPRTMTDAPTGGSNKKSIAKFEPIKWRWNIAKQLIPGFLARGSSNQSDTTPATRPRRVEFNREPSLWGRPPRSLTLIGGLRSESGLGQAARASSQALNLLERPYTHIDTSAVFPSRNSADPRLGWDSYGNYGDVNLIHSNADEMIAWAHGPYRHRFGGRFNAAMWFWETTQLPDQSQAAFDVIDELWVASEYLVDVFGQYGRVPVHNIGIATDLPESRMVDRSKFDLDDDEFVFLFVYDAFSSYGRKNPEKALQAFVNAFAPRFSGVRFILKVANLGKFPASQARLLQMQAKYPAIVIIDEYLAHDDVLDLMAAADVYLSLHSAEGYGLTLLEAMALGTPTICTGYSGNMDFTTASNSWLVDYEMVRIVEETGPYPAGSVWASPSVESATELMVRAEANRAEVVTKATLAQADAREAASLERYARRLDAQLRRVGV